MNLPPATQLQMVDPGGSLPFPAPCLPFSMLRPGTVILVAHVGGTGDTVSLVSGV